MMRPVCVILIVVAVGMLSAGPGCRSRQPEPVETLPPDQVIAPGSAEETVTLSNLTTSDQLITGALTNHSTRQVEDVHLLVNHSFLWKNERNPGRNNPSRTEYYRVAKPIPPGASMTFEYRPDPALPQRADGTFMTTVEVVSFAEIGN